MFHHVRGVFENPVGENHYTKTFLVTHNNFERSLKNQSAAGAREQAFVLAKLERAAVSEAKLDLQNIVDQRGIE